MRLSIENIHVILHPQFVQYTTCTIYLLRNGMFPLLNLIVYDQQMSYCQSAPAPSHCSPRANLVPAA
jgi:hypothetical protein